MKKDIEIPQATHVFIAALPERNADFNEESWYIYLINHTPIRLEIPLVVSRAYGTINGKPVKTSIFRHAFKELAPYTALKIELIDRQVFPLTNEFAVTYFSENKLHDKTFSFKPNTINTKALTDLPIIEQRGVLLK